MENSHGTRKFTANPRVRVTCGETLPNGAIIDLVAAADRDGVDLLLWDGKKEPLIAPVVDCGGVVYHPPYLHPSVIEAISFPKGAVEYGTLATLFVKICSLFQDHCGLPEGLAAFTTCWTLSSWIPELMLIPLTLCVSAPMHQICNLFRLLGSLCRRALLVAELSRRLPLSLNPTLMVNDPKLSARACASWRAANCHGLLVAGNGSSVSSLCCSKAVVLQPGDSPEVWGEEAMFLMLPHSECAPLHNQILANVRAEFQAQLEMLRLHLLSRMDPFVSKSHPLSKFELARKLGACIPEDSGIVRILTPMLESHQEDLMARRSRDPKVAIVEGVWGPSHKPGKMSPSEVAERVNAILNSRGEICQYNAREIGWLLRKLGLYTRRNRDNKVLQFSSEIRQRVHQLAQEFGLQLPRVKGCSDCKVPKVVDRKSVG